MSGIHQEVVFKASPQRVYDALTSGQQFSQVTGAPAEIGTTVGEAFSCFGGMITGRQLELVPGKRIVQSWRAGNWAEGVHSVIHLELEAQGADTKLVFQHEGFPSEMREHLEGGWHKMYWEPLAKHLS
jgi:uncharacterized protein YndB with AHSA1/START domain